ncbi:N-acetylmuramoyl-L-alanine amidase [Sporichthya sp.]|uniref:N-acetylmuramoyl-L-alanine amidase n=1 Tax=Sporichthya sp. TaxID=65475 RepID=UPI001842BDC6|nr:N-acetylmuramoyl-L-alanine amidase [Sporichthya sp.]MBA3741681.1 N-acetylmuramoyl-L-alanine amidase [Sporichthya sp.]
MLRLGDTGPPVAEVRRKLVMLSLLPKPDDALQDPEEAVYDDACDRAVRHFQQQRGLNVDGLVGRETSEVLEEARWRLGDRPLSHQVSRPLRGDDVGLLQRRLLDMGFNCGRADGIFGPETAQALRELQRSLAVNPDGICGPDTFRALDRLVKTVTGGHHQNLREAEALARSGPRLGGKVVVIDPGHGGLDHGNVANGLTEASIVEDLASRLEGRLIATGVQAHLTRSISGRHARQAVRDDEARATLANEFRADLFVSLHVDSHPSPQANGVATYFFGTDRFGQSSAMGQRFAELVLREIAARTDLLNCGTHGKTWDLLRRTKMPAVRLDLGYLTNPSDAARLADPAFRDVVAEAILVAVQRLYLPPDDDVPTGALRIDSLWAESAGRA